MSAPAHALRPGSILDPYVVVRLLDVGGTAVVWEVEHTVARTRHAMKVRARSDRWLPMTREGQAQAQLSSDHILAVTDTVPVNGDLGLILPLVEGPALDVLLATHRLRTGEALSLFRDVVQGVAAIHAAELVHRDIKPANVLLALVPGGVVPKVADFGLALHLGAPRGAGAHAAVTLGTPAYAAPEQLSDAETVDAGADLWSLGVLWVELLRGARPFLGDTLPELLAAHVRGPDLTGLAGPLREIAAWLLRVVPAPRPPTAAALLARLDELSMPRLPLGTDSDLYRAAWALRRDGSLASSTPERRSARPPARASAPVAPRMDGPRPQRSLRRTDPFVGRGAEMAELKRSITSGASLVSVLGPAGVGKSRLVREVASVVATDWPGGVWRCDLAEVRGVDGLLSAVASALDLDLAQRDRVGAVGAALAQRGRALFVLDTLDLAPPSFAAILQGWADQIREGVLITTSRVALNLSGERRHTLAPLPLPLRDPASVAELRRSDAGALLLARAERAVRGFALADGDAPIAAELLTALDGLPLAIELAAARLRVLGIRALRDRLADRHHGLGGARRAGSRHASMDAALDWSWGLLDPRERSALCQLSTLDGPFTLERAAATLGLSSAASSEIVSMLVDHSLLFAQDDAAQPRFGMLNTIRAFASSKASAREPLE